MKKQRIMGEVVFSSSLDSDPIAAAAALRKAGYEVTTLPEEFRSRLEEPGNDFIEVSIDGYADDKIIDVIWNEIKAIVRQYGGLCDSCGPIAPSHVPFVDLFEPIIRN